MTATTKKARRPKQRRLTSVWTPEEFFARTSWYRFGPNSPKRQAYEIIKRLLAERETWLNQPSESEHATKAWVERLQRTYRR